jgi:hypothetical protein
MMQRLRSFPFYVFGVIIFFVTHGYSEYTGLIPFADLFIFLLISLGIAALLLWLAGKSLRSVVKAGILLSPVLLFALFYGAIQDAGKGVAVLSSLIRYRVAIPLFIIAVITLFIYLKRTGLVLQQTTLYLNSLFALLIVIDLVVISKNSFSETGKGGHGRHKAIAAGAFDVRPDIYFILMDEYSGTGMLNTYFNYNNQPFEQFLRDQGFWVAGNPACNYQSTVLSMASMLSMDYLKWLPDENKYNESAIDVARAHKIISNNEVVSLVKDYGYDLFNYSFFDILHKPSFYNTGLLSVKLELITNKTLWACIEKDLMWNLRNKGVEGNWLSNRVEEKIKAHHKRIIDSTIASTGYNKTHPKFVYTHLLMPHEPFFCDSMGAEVHINPFNRSIPDSVRSKAYLQYLVYSTKVIKQLIDELMQKTNRKAVIILMSDHGYRGLVQDGKKVSAHNNFNALYLPDKDYSLFYDSISNVNQFRMLFNTLFKTQYSLLPDKK